MNGIIEKIKCNADKFYIDGQWVPPVMPRICDIINPSTEEICAHIMLGNSADIDSAILSARRAFIAFSQTSREERLDIFNRIIEAYKERMEDIAQAISLEMGAVYTLARRSQAPVGLKHFMILRDILRDFPFEHKHTATTHIFKESLGVCGFITPWNWPINQISCKVAPALAAGCTMVLKPSEVAPLNAIIFAEILDAAKVPKGVFNLVHGDGAVTGSYLSAHSGIDMLSFTGSYRAGVLVAKAAARTVKRVIQEMGGKSPNIILEDAPLEQSVIHGVKSCFGNAGQSCNAPTRMLIPENQHEQALEIAKSVIDKLIVGTPESELTDMGPVANERQFNKINDLIQSGIDEGARIICGGVGRPDGLSRGFYIKPTLFAGVKNDMRIAQEEIFGPVLSLLPYKNEREAIDIANDTPYGLAAYVQSGSLEHAQTVARQLRAGNVHINGAFMDLTAPFGGYKQSGNGRENGRYGLEEFLEYKTILGFTQS